MSLVGASDNGYTPLLKKRLGAGRHRFGCFAWLQFGVALVSGSHTYIVGGLHVKANGKRVNEVVLCVCYCCTRSADVVDPGTNLALSCAFLSVTATFRRLEWVGWKVWFSESSSEVLFRCRAHPIAKDGASDWLVIGVEWIHDAFHPCFVDLFAPIRKLSAWGVRIHWTR